MQVYKKRCEISDGFRDGVNIYQILFWKVLRFVSQHNYKTDEKTFL